MSETSNSWSVKSLGDVFKLKYGKPLPKEERDEKGAYPAYGANGVKCRTNQYYCDRPSIIVGRKGSAGEITLTKEKFWPLDVTYFVDFDEAHYDLMFLYYCLLSLKLQSLAKGVKPGINRNDVYVIKRAFPLLPEQKRIVAILNEAFAGISQAVANAEKNLANARELFESYLNNVFTQQSEGKVGYRMSEICAINSKLVDPKEEKYLDLPHVGAGNMVSNTGALVEIKTAREEGLISGKFIFDDSMILYSKIRPYLMKVCRPEFTGLCSADVYPLTTLADKIDKHYLFYLLLSKDFTDYAISGSGRAGMPKVNRAHLFNYSVSLPNIEKQREYVKSIDRIFERTQMLEKLYFSKLEKIAELKKSILQKAFTGELTNVSTKKVVNG